jgi:hypothetical protein
MISSIPVSCRVETSTPRQVPIFSLNEEGAAKPGYYLNGGTLSPRQLAASFGPRKATLRPSSVKGTAVFFSDFGCFGFLDSRLDLLWPFAITRLLTLFYSGSKTYLNTIWGDFEFCSAKSEKFEIFLQAPQASFTGIDGINEQNRENSASATPSLRN